MSKKVIKNEDVKTDKLKHFGFQVYETVERGEKVKKLEKVGEMEYTPGEIDMKVFSFDDDIEMGKAIIVQDRSLRTEKYTPKEFVPEESPVNAKEPDPTPEPEPEPEPEIPVITEEELEQARKDGHEAGLAEGLQKGLKQGRAEAEKEYEAQKSDYLEGLQGAYKDVITQLDEFSKAVTQLDEALPEMLVSMVQDIIGEELRINDKVIVSVANKSLMHLKELERVIFLVNPDDVETMKEAFPDYETQPDKNIMKGSLKVSTNIGEMNFSIKRIMEEFVGRIHEEFSPTEEG
ncbi:Flagellar assembly protein FliH/Type III secretion system HrpE [Denitrovibrio acetiphilus DSM 12809]|uniref:Flagellar assembly protein FliH n=1 Tax=Denitrovibrio acetiphilus (strain DSM 12809 / NBRC 114555 / N2460) TaxID=522772 RepID=D4H351_DENA2|nr:FliH/SctL family protein [Denitrovibrio acetiphilus]ADD69074.1 Flagellar assembly protein FliH/Type III secretion system HrpE [Denitrovibrio acetiphilus DSM 12809]